MNKYFVFGFLIVLLFKGQSINAQTIDNHFFFLNNSLVNSNPVTYAPGSVFLSGVDYNEGSNTGYPSYLGNYYSSNISMSPFCSSAKKTVYNFRKKTGLKFNNGSGSNFNDYTITVIIRFNSVVANTYNRVIDFSNGTSDNGIYAYGNNLNFYPTGNVAANVFNGGLYTFLTLTRDGTSKVINVYVNDNLVTSYTDSSDYYKFPSNGNIIFARDNIPPSSAPNEDTNGSIAYIHVTNNKSTAAEVKDVYNNICSLIPPDVDAIDDVAPDADGKNGVIGILNIFDNDTVDNKAIVAGNVTLTETIPDTTGNLILNLDGSVDLAPNTPVGDYKLTYKICDITYPSVCDNATVTVRVLPIPQIVSTVDGLICGNGLGTLSATASEGTINWYTTLSGGTSLGTGNVFITPLVSNTTTYYVDATENWRVTETRVPVTLVVQHTSIPTVNTTQSFCDINNAKISDLTATGTGIKWYDSATGGFYLKTSEPLTNTTYYVTQTLNTCESPRVAVNVIIYETVVLPVNIPNIEACDTDLDSGNDDTNGIALFNLRDRETILLNSKEASDFNFRYFRDATYIDEILTDPTVFENTVSGGQPIYVRIENIIDPLCFTDTVFNLVVNPLPILKAPIVNLKQCDTDTDGKTSFNLNEANKLISANYALEVFTFYKTSAAAVLGNNTNPDFISNDTNYTNPSALGSVVYARIETQKGCYRTAQVNLEVGASNLPATFFDGKNMNTCDDGVVQAEYTDGISSFDFTSISNAIHNTFLPLVVEDTYYESEADALAEKNAIIDITNHRNTNFPSTQTIYVRVDGTIVNDCQGFGTFTITVDPIPENNVINSLVLCSDNNTATFNLEDAYSDIIGTQTQAILVSYHSSLQNAIDNTPITTTPTAFLSISSTIYVRAQFDDNNNGIGDADECINTDITFNLIVKQNPVVFAPDPIEICSNQIDTEYNLTIRKDQITGGDNTINLTYFELDNTPIITPESYLSKQQNNIVIVLATGANGCISTTTLSLKTILYVNLNKNLSPIEECEVDNDGYDNFDIRRREEDILINGLNREDFEFLYYELKTDADDRNGNAIQTPEDFTNALEHKYTQTIYVNVKPKANECSQVIPITLIVNQSPPIAIEDEYAICLAANNTSISPVLITLLPNPPIDTKLNVTDYTFQWYHDTEGLPANIITGATGATYTPTVAGNYTVIATNRTTGCTIPATAKVFGSYPPESITVELVSNAFSGNNMLEVTVVGNGDYEYRLDDGEWQMENTFDRVRGGEITVYVRDLLNCNVISQLKIIMDYPKYFTPNGDGVHDTWNIRAISGQPHARIFVYDRFGKLLKQLSPLNTGWDGTFNGDQMPNNDYWFTVEYIEPKDGIQRVFKAHFTLKR